MIRNALYMLIECADEQFEDIWGIFNRKNKPYLKNF